MTSNNVVYPNSGQQDTSVDNCLGEGFLDPRTKTCKHLFSQTELLVWAGLTIVIIVVLVAETIYIFKNLRGRVTNNTNLQLAGDQSTRVSSGFNPSPRVTNSSEINLRRSSNPELSTQQLPKISEPRLSTATLESVSNNNSAQTPRLSIASNITGINGRSSIYNYHHGSNRPSHLGRSSVPLNQQMLVSTDRSSGSRLASRRNSQVNRSYSNL